MRTLAPVAAVTALLASVFAADAPGKHGEDPLAQSNRRDREAPELVLETGGRTGRCDNLRFTPDGKRLLAVGDDKVVHVWTFADGKIDPASVRELRWGIWREQRGSIYAMSISSDSKRVAIAGFGALKATVAVLNIASGDIVDLVVAPNDPKIGEVGAFWTLAFSDSGKRVAVGGGDGSVWIWDLESHALRRLGKPDSDRTFNVVRLLRFEDEDHLLSLAEDGRLLRWTVGEAKPGLVMDLALPVGVHVFRAEMSRDGQWLAAAANTPLVVLRPVGGGPNRDIPLKGYKDPQVTSHDREFARALAFDPDGRRLAVAVGSFVAGGAFALDADDRVVFYDIGPDSIKASDGPPHTYRADRLTFHPDGGFLAAAGGENHEVTLWKLASLNKPVSLLRGVGAGLWDAALSEDGRLGLRDQRKATSTEPNERGQGPWRVFDLARRLWVPADDFKPTPRNKTSGGWTVEPDANDPYVWYAVHTSGIRNKLPLDRDRDGTPRCYTFLDAKNGGHTHLVVGHYWGLSVFELTATEARRTRQCIGHAGEVTALAPSADQTWLAACSDDQTVSAWSLTQEWPSQSILGASFQKADDHLTVTAVDVGSPAWEAGLVAQDEVRRFGFAGAWQPNDPGQWLERLTHPAPGLEHAFDVVRDGKHVIMLTTVKQRPLWRFFPAGDEWVLWMWRNSYYDSSLGGDKFLGWHLNGVNPKDPPSFYPLEKFSEHFRRPDVIKRLIKSRDPQEVLNALASELPPLGFGAMEPPAAKLEMADAAAGKDVPATLSVRSHGVNPDQDLVKAEVWINDFRLENRMAVMTWPKTEEGYTHQLTIPYDKLRSGRNVVTFQVWNRSGGRADATAVVMCDRNAPDAPQLVGLAVGINKYDGAAGGGGKGALSDLKQAVNDADSLWKAWKQQKLYAGTDKFTILVDKDATQQKILDALDKLKSAGPDDRCIIFLSGHGYGWTEPAKQPGEPDQDLFAFCLPNFDPDKPFTTGIGSDVLSEKLAVIPCRKLVILDACHAGSVASEDGQVRRFAPQGQGPVILAACDRSQESIEDSRPAIKHGLFTYAVLEALGDKFAAADHNGDNLLDVAELYQYTCDRLPKLLVLTDRHESEQIPKLWSPQGDNFPVAKK